MVRLICRAALACLASASAFAAGNVGNTPSALFVNDVHDWGTMRPPKSGYVEADLVVRNRASEGDLQIVDVKPGCGCTTAEPARRVLAPGEETTVHVKLNIAPTQNGPLQRNVTFRSVHGSDTTVQTMSLKIDIARMLVVGPTGFVAINDAKVGVASQVLVTITNPGPTPIAIADVKTEDGLTVTLTNDVILAPKEQRQVTVSYTPSSAGQFQRMLRFTARTEDETDEVQIPAYGTAVN
jgi:hypothetical protein